MCSVWRPAQSRALPFECEAKSSKRLISGTGYFVRPAQSELHGLQQSSFNWLDQIFALALGGVDIPADLVGRKAA